MRRMCGLLSRSRTVSMLIRGRFGSRLLDCIGPGRRATSPRILICLCENS